MNDTTGATTNPTSSKALWKLIDEAIEHCIPYIEKTGYLEAKIKSPQLVENETNPIRFLTYEKWNVWAAARRIVKYWEWKRAIFGEHRAFLPILDVTGNGAMSETDMKYIRTGVAVILPNDNFGNTVLYFNRYRIADVLLGETDWDSLETIVKTRITFFSFFRCVEEYYQQRQVETNRTFEIMMQRQQHLYQQQQQYHNPEQDLMPPLDDDIDEHDESTQTGIVGMVLVNSFVQRPSRNFRDLVVEAMPIKILRTIVIFHPPSAITSKNSWSENSSLFNINVSKYLIPAFLSSYAPLLKFMNVYPICCSDATNVAIKLSQVEQQFGLRSDNIPTSLGGSWSYEYFYNWFGEQEQYYKRRQSQQRQEPIQPHNHHHQNHSLSISAVSDVVAKTSLLTCNTGTFTNHSIHTDQFFPDVISDESSETTLPMNLLMDIHVSGTENDTIGISHMQQHQQSNKSTEDVNNVANRNPIDATSSRGHSQRIGLGIIVSQDINQMKVEQTTRPSENSPYWKMRRELFGDNRYLLSMNQLGCKLSRNIETILYDIYMFPMRK
jgi:hypothetical protein